MRLLNLCYEQIITESAEIIKESVCAGNEVKLGRCFMILCFTLKQSCATIAYSLVVFDIALDGDIELAKPSRQR